MNNTEEIWKNIVEIHQFAKELWIIGEEISGQTFIQPLQEQRHALEHIIRARIEEQQENRNDKYIQRNLEKALGHEYRSFFDVADWVSLNIREKIQNLMGGYSSDCIAKVFPVYYQEIRPTLEKMNLEIANIRGKKDISKNEELIPQAEYYRTKIKELLEFQATITIFTSQLKECKKEENRKKFLSKFWGIILISLGAFFAWLFSFLKCKQ